MFDSCIYECSQRLVQSAHIGKGKIQWLEGIHWTTPETAKQTTSATGTLPDLGKVMTDRSAVAQTGSRGYWFFQLLPR